MKFTAWKSLSKRNEHTFGLPRFSHNLISHSSLVLRGILRLGEISGGRLRKAGLFIRALSLFPSPFLFLSLLFARLLVHVYLPTSLEFTVDCHFFLPGKGKRDSIIPLRVRETGFKERIKTYSPFEEILSFIQPPSSSKWFYRVREEIREHISPLNLVVFIKKMETVKSSAELFSLDATT